jgi:hypothetical protein
MSHLPSTTPHPSYVRPCHVAVASRAVVLALCIGVHGCGEVDGGAVELSWKLRAASGSGSEDSILDCNVGIEGTRPVTHIRLDWEVDGMSHFRQWECDENHGVTGFELPEGTALLRVSPICSVDDVQMVAAAETYTAPPPEQRTVIVGNTVSLGGVELLLVVSDCDKPPLPGKGGPCICQ